MDPVPTQSAGDEGEESFADALEPTDEQISAWPRRDGGVTGT